MVTVVNLAALTVFGVAHAGVPAWCKGASVESDDLRGLSSKEPEEVIKAFVSAACAPSAEANERRAEIEAARQAWSKRLGMIDTDWADAVDYVTNGTTKEAEIKTKVFATASPIDQYAVITRGLDGEPSGRTIAKSDAYYAADMFEGRLSDVGRYGFLKATCLDVQPGIYTPKGGTQGNEVQWALCQQDLEHFDLTKFQNELRADGTHGGAIKMRLRLDTYRLPKQLKDHADQVTKLLAADEANKKLFAVVAAARSEWATGIGTNTKLLELVLAMESARFAQSRKQLDGCVETTRAALAESVSAFPAKAFAGFKDKRQGALSGFARSAAPVLAQSPAFGLAAIAYVQCNDKDDIATWLLRILEHAPGSRGPRNAALAKARAAKITYDNVEAQLSFPQVRPFGGQYLDGEFFGDSAGGEIKSVKRAGETLRVELVKSLVTSTECVKEHYTKKVERIRDDGVVVYALACDKTGVVTHDTSWAPFELDPQYAAVLKPGQVFSASGKHVIAIWPNAKAKEPSWVLGASLK